MQTLSRIRINTTHSDDEKDSMIVNFDKKDKGLRQRNDSSTISKSECSSSEKPITLSDSETLSVPTSPRTCDYPFTV